METEETDYEMKKEYILIVEAQDRGIDPPKYVPRFLWTSEGGCAKELLLWLHFNEDGFALDKF